MSDRSPEAGRCPRLLVLGAGSYQIPALQAARNLGMHVIALDRNDKVPGAALADAFHSIDTTDREAVARLALAENVDGVIAPCTDVAVPTQAYVAGVIGSPGPGVEAAETLTDKARFRAYQAWRGLPHPRAIEADPDCFDAASLTERAYVLKPARSSGSKGIFVVAPDEIGERLPQTLAYSPDRRFVVETFITGTQGTVEGLWIGGEIALAVVTDRLTAPAPLVATLGHLWPGRFDEDFRQRLLDAIADILADLGVPDSPFDCDFVAGPDGPVVLELTPRLGGNSLSKLVRAATGTDLPAQAVRLALPRSLRPQILPPETPMGPAAGVIVLGSPAPGRLAFDEVGEASLKAEPWLAGIAWDMPAGAAVRRFANGQDRVGEALFLAPDRTVLDARHAEILQRLKVSARPC